MARFQMNFRLVLAFAVLFLTVLVGGSEKGTASGASVSQRRSAGIIRRAEAVTGDRFPVVTSTPGGVRVFATGEPAPAMLRAIDDGFRDLFAVARRNGFRARLQISDYTVFIARADRTRNRAGVYSPDLKVAAGGYAGTDFDQGGYVYAAGMVLTMEPSSFVIPEHTRDWMRVREVVRFEGEHIVLYHNDRRRYEATLDHSRSGAHPILQ